MYVNTNGNVTFDGPFGTYTPFAFPGGTKMVAPFFADVDTRVDRGASNLVYWALDTTSSPRRFIAIARIRSVPGPLKGRTQITSPAAETRMA